MGLTAGDIRARDMPGLAAMHTVWLREHNRIALLLRTNHGMTDNEEIYQLARKIVGAEMQSVVYGQWLPAVLGQAKMDEEDLTLNLFSSYNQELDAGIFNSFATAAFRYTISFGNRTSLFKFSKNASFPLLDGFYVNSLWPNYLIKKSYHIFLEF